MLDQATYLLHILLGDMAWRFYGETWNVVDVRQRRKSILRRCAVLGGRRKVVVMCDEVSVAAGVASYEATCNLQLPSCKPGLTFLSHTVPG